MHLDIRIPIGLMFALLGAILTVYGVFTASDPAVYRVSQGINMNLWCGLAYLAFAGTMLLLARRSRKPD